MSAREELLDQIVNKIDDNDDQKKRAICGGIHTIEGAQNSLEIASLARFAVDEHNKKENALLEFGKVVSAKKQMVAGLLYYITMEVTDGGDKKEYEAKVYVRSWENFKELTEFKPVKPL